MGNCLKCFQSTQEHTSATLGGSGTATATALTVQSVGHTTHLVDGRYTGISGNINANEGHHHHHLQHHQMYTVRGGAFYKERSHGKFKTNTMAIILLYIFVELTTQCVLKIKII